MQLVIDHADVLVVVTVNEQLSELLVNQYPQKTNHVPILNIIIEIGLKKDLITFLMPLGNYFSQKVQHCLSGSNVPPLFCQCLHLLLKGGCWAVTFTWPIHGHNVCKLPAFIF